MARYTTDIPTEYLTGRKDATRWLRHGNIRNWGRRLISFPPARLAAGMIPWHRFISFPPMVSIEITNRCNLNCVFCYRFHAKTRTQGSMGFDLFKLLIDELVQSPPTEILLTGFGEPLYLEDFDRFLHHLTERGLQQVFLITNGTLLTDEKTDSILSAGIRSIHFSIEGNSRETYNSVRVGGDFEETLGNISRFLEERNRRKLEKPTVVIRTIAMPETAHELDDLKRRWHSLLRPTDEIQVQPLIRLDEEFQKDHTGGTTYPNTNERPAEPARRPPCTVLWKRLSISWKGEFMFCCAPGLRSDLHLGLKFPELSIRDAWRHDSVKKVRRLHILGRKADIPACSDCYQV